MEPNRKPMAPIKPAGGLPYSTAKPANHGAFKATDGRVNAFNALKQIEGLSKLGRDILDDRKALTKTIEQIRGLCVEVEKA